MPERPIGVVAATLQPSCASSTQHRAARRCLVDRDVRTSQSPRTKTPRLGRLMETQGAFDTGTFASPEARSAVATRWLLHGRQYQLLSRLRATSEVIADVEGWSLAPSLLRSGRPA